MVVAAASPDLILSQNPGNDLKTWGSPWMGGGAWARAGSAACFATVNVVVIAERL